MANRTLFTHRPPSPYRNRCCAQVTLTLTCYHLHQHITQPWHSHPTRQNWDTNIEKRESLGPWDPEWDQLRTESGTDEARATIIFHTAWRTTEGGRIGLNIKRDYIWVLSISLLRSSLSQDAAGNHGMPSVQDYIPMQECDHLAREATGIMIKIIIFWTHWDWVQPHITFYPVRQSNFKGWL